MQKSNIPTEMELPSTSKLIKSTLLAAAIAGVLLVTVVMPAEYGIDPTGIGSITGLKKMGDIRVSLDKEAAADKAKDISNGSSGNTTKEPTAPSTSPDTNTKAESTPVSTSPTSAVASARKDEMQVTLAPDEGAEVKVDMSKGKKVKYTWSTNGGKANFDVHADSQKLKIDYHQYSKGAEQRKEGEIVAAFDGSHGWFWRNRTSTPITITLNTQGEYTEIGRKK